jgi:hypothetical protein
MLKPFMSVLGMMALMLFTTPASAEGARARIIKATFYSDNGDQTAFNATEGGAIHITQLSTKKEYRMVSEITSRGEVQFKIYDVASDKLLDTLGMSNLGAIKGSVVVPFSLSVEGVEESTELTSSQVNKYEGQTPSPLASSCCLRCGGYQFCCYPRPGYCCTLSTSCNNACKACR